jgi:hypothetical protein
MEAGKTGIVISGGTEHKHMAYVFPGYGWTSSFVENVQPYPL